MPNVKCQQCGSSMKKSKRSEKNMSLQLVGVSLFIIGLCWVFLPPIGTVVGLVLMCSSLFLGFKQYKVWKCSNCDHFFQRD